jgi:hypothetical protein
MRKIKFRCISLTLQPEIIWYEWINEVNQWAHKWVEKDGTTRAGENSCLWMYIRDQYTWLDDKNGKEIYENDIIKAPVFLASDNIQEWYLVQVKWSEQNWCWLWNGWLTEYNAYHSEIIWNIHQNPELLTN